MIKIILLYMLINYLIWFITGKKKTNTLCCGLVGWYSDELDCPVDKLKILLLFNETRGSDSTGLYIKDIGIAKALGKASETFLPKIKIPVKNSKLVIGHTRQGTYGAKIKKNSHPFIFGDIVLAHNGRVSNKYDLCKEFELNNLDYDVDSEIIPALMDKFKTSGDKDFIINTLLKVQGPQALIFTDESLEDNTLYFYRKSQKFHNDERPLFRGEYSESGKRGYFLSSIESSLEAIGCISIKEVLEDTLYYYSSKGGLKFKKINFPEEKKPEPKTYYTYPSYDKSTSKAYNSKIDWFEIIDKEMKNLSTGVDDKPFLDPDYTECPACLEERWLDHEGKNHCVDCDGTGWIKKTNSNSNNDMDTGNEAELRELSRSSESPFITGRGFVLNDIVLIISGPLKGSLFKLIESLSGKEWLGRRMGASPKDVGVVLEEVQIVVWKTYGGVIYTPLEVLREKYGITNLQIKESILKGLEDNNIVQPSPLITTEKKANMTLIKTNKELDTFLKITDVKKGDLLSYEVIGSACPICEIIDINKVNAEVKLRWLTEKPGNITTIPVKVCWNMDKGNYTIIDMIEVMTTNYPKEELLDKLYNLVIDVDDNFTEIQDLLNDPDKGRGNVAVKIFDYKEKLRLAFEDALKEKIEKVDEYTEILM